MVQWDTRIGPSVRPLFVMGGFHGVGLFMPMMSPVVGALNAYALAEPAGSDILWDTITSIEKVEDQIAVPNMEALKQTSILYDRSSHFGEQLEVLSSRDAR